MLTTMKTSPVNAVSGVKLTAPELEPEELEPEELDVVEPEVLAVAVTEPDPGVAVPVLVEPAF